MSSQTITMIIEGDKGSGKTLLMCIFSLLFELFGLDFYANFHLFGDFVTHRKDFTIKNFYNNPSVEGLFLDEMHNIANQYSNNTLETQLLVALFTQSRKRSQLIMMTTLEVYKLAKDLRFLADIVVYPSYDKQRDILEVFFLDYKKTGRLEKRLVYNASRFFKFYDTFEIVISPEIKKGLTNYMLNEIKLQKDALKELPNEDLEILDNLDERLKKKK